MEDDLKPDAILCVYCNAPWTDVMLKQLRFCEGSYTPDCVGSVFITTTDIHCGNCLKLIYRKQYSIANPQTYAYDEERWKGFYD